MLNKITSLLITCFIFSNYSFAYFNEDTLSRKNVKKYQKIARKDFRRLSGYESARRLEGYKKLLRKKCAKDQACLTSLSMAYSYYFFFPLISKKIKKYHKAESDLVNQLNDLTTKCKTDKEEYSCINNVVKATCRLKDSTTMFSYPYCVSIFFLNYNK